MKERPLLFSAPMVRAVLNGTKTQTRRIVKPQPDHCHRDIIGKPKPWATEDWNRLIPQVGDKEIACPYGVPGDRLYVKEAVWIWCEKRPNGITKTGRDKWHYVPFRSSPLYYCADHPNKPQSLVSSPLNGNEWGWRKKIGRFMPRQFSRITLEITEVRVERLNEISERDAIAEGASPWPFNAEQPMTTGELGASSPYRGGFAVLWDDINVNTTWFSNPFVWVISFKRIEAAR